MNDKIQKILDLGYQFPTVPKIGADAKKLYRLEEKMFETVRESAKEVGNILDHEPTEFYTKTIGESLYAILDHYDTRAATLTCVEFLKRQGIEIKE